MKRTNKPRETAPKPTAEDIEKLDQITRKRLGDQATGQFLGALVTGVKGDEAFYGHAVVINDTDITKYRDDIDSYYDRLDKTAHNISSALGMAGNVVIDITHLARKDYEK